MPDQRYEANRRTLGTLLSSTSPRIQIPDWQRSYSWGADQVEQFWSDLLAFSDQYPEDNIENQEYFLGSIVLVTGGSTLLLLDGQQRLATTTILLSSLRDARRKYNADAAARLQSKYVKDLNDATGAAEYVLTLGEYDRDFFRRAIQDDPTTRPNIKLRSHALISKARDFFDSQLNKRSETLDGGEPFFKWNLRVSRVLTDHMSVVAVTSSDEDNAASVFETLNDRGIGLSTPDLLRNLLLRKAVDQSARERMVSGWQQVLGLSEDSISVDQFLRHFWVSIRGDVKARSLYREMKHRIDEEGIDALQLTEDLASSAYAYRDLAKSNYEMETLKESLDALADLGASVMYPLLLAAVNVAEEDGQVAELASFLVSLFVRYNVIGSRETTVLESAVYAAAKDLRSTKDFDGVTTTLRDLVPSLREFRRQFEHASIRRTATARYLLRSLEHRMRLTEEITVAGPSRVHVEHIYPQHPPTDRKLPGHAGIINRLGNLTILSRRLNQAIKNADFPTKRDRAYSVSELLVTNSLKDHKDQWTITEIQARQKTLAALAAEIWRFPGEPDPSPMEPTDADSSSSELLSGLDPNQLPDTPESEGD